MRLLIRKLNNERKKQTKKIDILCNDFIAAQRDFIKRLNTISFAADFCESIIGSSDLNMLLRTASKIFKNRVTKANISFFLRRTEGFELHMFERDKPIALDDQHLENCFSTEVVDNICRSNKLCTIDDMFAMGLQGNLTRLNRISAVTIPLGQFGSSLGFILIYRSSQNKLTADEINDVCTVTNGLSRAISTCREPSKSPD